MENLINILRDPIWQGIGVFVAIILALLPFLKDVSPRFSMSFVKKIFWIGSIPVLSTISIAAIMWNIIWLSILSNLLIIIFYWIRYRSSEETKNRQETNEKTKDFRKKADNSSRYPKSVRQR